jgi:hypothetical protein
LTGSGDYHPTSLLLARDFLKEDPRVPKCLIKGQKISEFYHMMQGF